MAVNDQNRRPLGARRSNLRRPAPTGRQASTLSKARARAGAALRRGTKALPIGEALKDTARLGGKTASFAGKALRLGTSPVGLAAQALVSSKPLGANEDAKLAAFDNATANLSEPLTSGTDANGNFVAPLVTPDSAFQAAQTAQATRPDNAATVQPTNVASGLPASAGLNQDITPSLSSAATTQADAALAGQSQSLRDRIAQRRANGTGGTLSTFDGALAKKRNLAGADAIRAARAAQLGIPENTLDLLGNGVRVADIKQALLQQIANDNGSGAGSAASTALKQAELLRKTSNDQANQAIKQNTQTRETTKLRNTMIDRAATKPDGTVDQRKKNLLAQILGDVDPNSPAFQQALDLVNLGNDARATVDRSSGLIEGRNNPLQAIDIFEKGGPFRAATPGISTPEELQAQLTQLRDNPGSILGNQINEQNLSSASRKQLELLRQGLRQPSLRRQ